MTTFNTDYIWNELAERGKIVTSWYVATEEDGDAHYMREALAGQLIAEARKEGVYLRINRVTNKTDLLYIYLKKNG